MMKKILSILLMVLVIASVASLALAKPGKTNEKVAICHIPKGNPENAHTIWVSENAVKAHLAHGDYLGECKVQPQEPVLVDTVQVDAANINGADSTIALETGKTYKFVATGTVTGNKSKNGRSDAEYFTPPGSNWQEVYDGTAYQGYPGSGEDQMDLQIDQEFVAWGEYNPEHSYSIETTGTDSTVNFRIYDGDLRTGEPSASWYGDNDGFLTVEIYEMP